MEVTKKRLDQISRKKKYGQRFGENVVWFEPTPEEVKTAVENREFALLGFQEHEPQLIAILSSLPDDEARIRWLEQYHILRIAFFWEFGWKDEDLIKVCSHDVLEDGGHRLLAAKYKGDQNVDCVIVKCNKCLQG